MISILLPPSCRFSLCCSDFAVLALQKHGVVHGCWLAINRIAKCHPFYNTTGYDPVP